MSRLRRAGSEDGRVGEEDGYDNFDVKGALGVEVGAASRLDLSFGYVNADLDYDGFGSPFEVSTLTNSIYEKRYGARWSGDYLQGFWRPSLQGTYYSRQLDDVGFESRGGRSRFEWRNDLLFSDVLKLVAGVETELEKARGSKSARTNAVYAQAWFAPFNALSLSLGWRNDDPDDFGSDRNWQVAAVYDFAESGMRLRTSYGTAFKAPTLSERFGFGGNPELSPETSRSREIGIEQSLMLGDTEVGWGVTYFDNRIRDLITFAGSDFRNVNLNSAHIEGLESFVFANFIGGTDLRLDHTVMSPYDGMHEPLLRRPRRKATLTTSWTNPLWSVAAKLDYIGPQRDIRRDTFVRVTKGGYTLAQLSARRQLGDDLALFASVRNLLDKRYEPVDGYAGRGLEFRVGLETHL